eukprot:CAMPEP_0202472766 /NCGR_PEP_ID=MMETSP1360-20130828/88816_1 /ASSEMBLY_ACC=CAM_ASM_000848 /TAXON_ID=515479 /ORGANISM="Licmophora paradoxa, Strain CCMP2313" /LENGTH=188 /DNA_ID=CAMNT_0049099403 /DNA_START=466 /DNA_END=1032 /DNA_ORIENTATION=+
MYGHRFPATDLVKNPDPTVVERWKHESNFPNIHNLIEAKRLGEAAVMISHVRVLQKMIDTGHEYAFICEDDAVFGNLTRVLAPHPVDIIFLSSHILRATYTSPKMIRVMGGAGTYGWMITKRGAQKLLKLFEKGSCGWFDGKACSTDALDIAIMKYAARYNLQVYLPIEWPLVRHSSRLGSSKTKRDS